MEDIFSNKCELIKYKFKYDTLCYSAGKSGLAVGRKQTENTDWLGFHSPAKK